MASSVCQAIPGAVPFWIIEVFSRADASPPSALFRLYCRVSGESYLLSDKNLNAQKRRADGFDSLQNHRLFSFTEFTARLTTRCFSLLRSCDHNFVRAHTTHLFLCFAHFHSRIGFNFLRLKLQLSVGASAVFSAGDS